MTLHSISHNLSAYGSFLKNCFFPNGSATQFMKQSLFVLFQCCSITRNMRGMQTGTDIFLPADQTED